jgi:SAM-dependent methyltransferase
MIEIARRDAINAGAANASFDVADAAASGLPTASFDGAVTRFSIHHVPVPGRLIREMARVVRPSGRIVVADHLADDDGEARAWSQELERLRDPSHWASMTADGLRTLGREADLELISEQRFGYELDFDEWLARGASDGSAQELVELALRSRPTGANSFGIERREATRILTLQIWIGVWRRSRGASVVATRGLQHPPDE